MKNTGFVLSALLALTLMASTATAEKKDGKMGNPCAMMGQDGMMGSMMQERHQMGQEMMEMLKETMSILKGLNHQPTAAEKQKLGEMIGRMDAIMEKHKTMMEKKQEWKDKKMEKKEEMMEKRMEKKEMMGK